MIEFNATFGLLHWWQLAVFSSSLIEYSLEEEIEVDKREEMNLWEEGVGWGGVGGGGGLRGAALTRGDLYLALGKNTHN